MKKKVLIIDDNSDFVISLHKYIQCEIPYVDIIGIASNGEEAIEYMEKLKPNIVLLDLKMPKLDGCEVLKRINDTNIKVILISGEIPMINKIDLQDWHNVERIYVKPFEFCKLKDDLKCLVKRDKEIEFYDLINEELSKFNFNKGSIGYKYLTKCIITVLENPRKLDNIEKLLFPNIAYQLKIDNPKVIKWSIQKLMDSMIRYTENDVILKYFP